MAGLIKSQILKHLSKFAKKINSESVNVSTLRGEGELKNLELNEDVLTDLLELPTWLRITHASVNRVSVKIQWTKLKSVPIHLSLDKVCVAIETCDKLRSQAAAGSSASSYASGGHYGFSDKVIDGLTVTVNSIHVTFRSPVFTAVFQMAQVMLDSRSPGWQRVVDLRMTRLKDTERQMLLLFKELSWQSLRIEAQSNDPGTEQQQLAPLRLITNACHCRITIKKKLTDCSVVGCRLVVLLDDLLWVLTDSQLITACHFAHSLTDLVKQATQQSHKVKAVRKLESLPDFYGHSQHLQQQHPSVKGVSNAPGASVFNKFDVIETSYHFVCEQIDLHLCDDPGSGRSSHPLLTGGASLQLTLSHLRVDYYPYHLAGGDRTHWIRYSDCGPQQLVLGSLFHFRQLLVEALSGSRTSHAPLSRAPPHSGGGQDTSMQGRVHPSSKPPPPSHTNTSNGSTTSTNTSNTSQLKAVVLQQMCKLMASCCVLSIRDFVVYRATTSKRRQPPREFVATGLSKTQKKDKRAGDKERLCLPNQTSSVHLEFLHYYYPGDCDCPVPPPAVYGSVCPLRVVLDLLSVLWVNAFGRALQLAVLPDPATSPPQYLDLHVQFVMPRVILEAGSEPVSGQQRDRPRGMQVQSSRVTLSNFRPPDPAASGSLAALAATLEAAQTAGELFFASGFPALAQDCLPVATKFVRHAMGEDDIRHIPKCAGLPVCDSMSALHRESLWTEARDLIFLHCEPVWVEFTGTPSSKHRPLPFVDAFPLSVWIHLKIPGIKDGVPVVPGAVDDYSPVGAAPDTIGPEVNAKTATEAGDASAEPYQMSDAERSVKAASARVKREKSIGRKEAGLNVLVHCHSLVSCQLNHYQYLFLMRQLDMLTEMSAFLTCDTAVIYQAAGEDESWIRDIEDSLVISAIIPQVDVSFVIPPLHPAKDSILGDMEGFVPDSSSTVGEVQEIDSLREMRGSTSDHSIHQRTQSSYCGTASGLQAEGGSTADITKSQSDGQLASGNITQSNSPNCSKRTTTAFSVHDSVTEVTNSVNSIQPTPSVHLISSTAASHTSINSTNAGAPTLPSSSIQDNLNMGLSSMKKGFSNFMTTFESSVKTSPEDLSDTISIQSDLSSDSENFVLLNFESNHFGGCERSDSGLGMEAAFRADTSRMMENAVIEIASEAVEEITPSEEISDITSSLKGKSNIALVNFQVSGVQFVQEVHGYDSIIKLQARQVSASDCNAIPYDEFQSKFSSRVRGWSETFNQHQQCIFKIRLETKEDHEDHAATTTADLPECSVAADSGAATSATRPAVTTHSNGDVAHGTRAGGASTTGGGGGGGMFARVGSFSFGGPLRMSLDHSFDEDTGGGDSPMNLWKKCTSYSPKIKHILPKWTRLSQDGGATGAATYSSGACNDVGSGDVRAGGGISMESAGSAAAGEVKVASHAQAAALGTSDCTLTGAESGLHPSLHVKRYSVPTLPGSVQSSLRASFGDTSLSLLLSSITGLTELVQDELLPPPMYCQLELHNLSLNITEDHGSASISTASCPPQTTRVIIPALAVDRDINGTILLRTPSPLSQHQHYLQQQCQCSAQAARGATATPSSVDRSPEVSRLRAEVLQLRQSLKSCDNILQVTRDENASLKEAIRLLKLDCEQLQKVATRAETHTAAPSLTKDDYAWQP